MWPDQPYADSRGSFRRPVPLPLFDPSASPTLTFSVNCAWLPYIRGALQQLLLQATWATDNPTALLTVQSQAFNLIDIFQECETPPAFACPFNFTTAGAGSGGFVNEPDSYWTPTSLGDLLDSVGWVATGGVNTGAGQGVTAIEIHKLFSSPITINGLYMQYFLTKGSYTGGTVNNYIRAFNGGSPVAIALEAANTAPDGVRVLTWSGSDVTCDEIYMQVIANFAGADTEGNGVGQIWQYAYNVVGGPCDPE